jgi:hypothetical protein
MEWSYELQKHIQLHKIRRSVWLPSQVFTSKQQTLTYHSGDSYNWQPNNPTRNISTTRVDLHKYRVNAREIRFSVTACALHTRLPFNSKATHSVRGESPQALRAPRICGHLGRPKARLCMNNKQAVCYKYTITWACSTTRLKKHMVKTPRDPGTPRETRQLTTSLDQCIEA